MKERPILFNGPMVRAIREGRKTQTRRVVKQRAMLDYMNEVGSWDGPGDEMEYAFSQCPYGQPGDRLWVRETWCEDPEDDGTWAYTQYMGCKGSPMSDIPAKFRKPEHCIYREDWDGPDLIWRPSIHMPRWASRILLEIVSVRVERLCEISEWDANSEGCEFVFMNQSDDIDTAIYGPDGFKALWESINGAGSWDANPWVWCVEFKRVEGGAK